MKNASTRTAADYREQARKALRGRWESAVAPFILAILLVLFVPLVIGFILLFVMVDPSWTALGILIGLALVSPMVVGYSYISLRLVKSRKKISSDQLGYAYRHCFGKSVLACVILYLIAVGIVFVCSFAGGFLGQLIWSILNVFFYLDVENVIGLTVIALLIPGYVLLLRISLGYAMFPYVMIEHPKMSVGEVLRASKEMMEGNRWRLFCLCFSFIGWYLLSVLSLGIGFLFLVPYMSASQAAFYRDVARANRRQHPFRGLFRRRSR